ncbi:MAG TPA: DUF983 domain-containing protein [Ktedonobacterales bacterium]|jgi:uncharacterized protein (DUF983 family)|nr:DUF983 domain-containing protein [Ktedonobacterales bacterium]
MFGVFGLLFWRGLRLRCPRCGVGKLYQHGYHMYESCGSCGWVFEREEGYWTGAIAVNLVVTELLIFFAIFPLLIFQAPLVWSIVIGLGLAVLTPFAFYRHSKSLWMAMDFMLHPTDLVTAGRIMTVEELRRLVSAPSSPEPGAAHPFNVDEQQRDVGGTDPRDA